MPLDQTLGKVYTSSNPNDYGRSNLRDPFVGYPDFPNTNAILQPRKASFTPTQLGSTVKSYHGTQEDINILALWGASKYFSYTIEELPDQVFKIEFTLPYDEITYTDNETPELVQWEIIPNAVTRNLFDAGIYYTKPDGVLSDIRYTVPPPVQLAILDAVKKRGQGQTANFIPKPAAGIDYSQYASIAQQFYYLMLSGVEGIRSYTITVKRTSVYSLLDPRAIDNYPLINQLNEGGVTNLIISTKDLIDLYQVPATTAQSLMNSYLRAKTSTSAGDPVNINIIGGYLIQRPIRQFLTPTKVQISQEFQFDEWIDNCYKLYSSPLDFQIIGGPYPPS